MFPAFKPNNHPNQVKRRGVADDIDDRGTPSSVYDPLHAEFSFSLDAAASHDNRKCDKYCTLAGTFLRVQGQEPEQISDQDGLHHPWRDAAVYVNPPFSRIRPWVEKIWDESQATAVLLLPNNRAEQPFFQQLIEPYRDRPGSIVTTRNLAKRRPFLVAGKEVGNRTSKSPPFGLTVVVWDRRGRRPSLG